MATLKRSSSSGAFVIVGNRASKSGHSFREIATGSGKSAFVLDKRVFRNALDDAEKTLEKARSKRRLIEPA
ncbi:hypothetical protein ACIKT0_12160 [Hansschlegelia beijingensis]|uniref:hypothetical protein n=1 Tax=Hansschlegelia beijingensis TaxID=1133344 RepID=UPI00387EFA9A